MEALQDRLRSSVVDATESAEQFKPGTRCGFEEAEPRIWVNNGLKLLGRVYGDDPGPFCAEAGDGVDLGSFANLKDARSAIWREWLKVQG